MYKIIKKQKLAEGIFKFDIRAPLIARRAKAGQFVIIRVVEKGERIPLTITDFNREQGIVSLVAMRAGKTTSMLSNLNQDDLISDVVGPLGRESEIRKFGKVICVGGGVGTAPVMPIARALKKAGNYVISIIGAKSKDYLILVSEMDSISDELYICSDDGSIGFGGFVSDFLKDYLEKNKTYKNKSPQHNLQHNIDRVIAIGPAPMMCAVSNVTRPYKIKTIVSLNSIMVDGTGMCGTCRVEVGGETKFVCVDGPEFDGHKVNFDLLFARQKIYCEEEKLAMDLYKRECKFKTKKFKIRNR